VKRTFRPTLPNGPGGDPLVLVQVRWSARRILFDLGEATAVATRDLMRVRHVLLSHAHLDHLIGFDHLLRLHLGRETRLRVTGPEGTSDRLAGKLRGYTWNLVESYPFELEVADLAGETLRRTLFRAREAFRPEPLEEEEAPGGVVWAEDELRATAAPLDHGIVSLAFALHERERLNVRAGVLEELGLRPGAWLRALKERVRAGAPDGEPLDAEEPGGRRRPWSVGEAARALLQRAPGQTIAYVTDCAHTEENASAVERLARGADPLLCEAPFLDEDREIAARRRHLTARQAGELARRAGARSLALFHFSPRYAGEFEAHRLEAAEAFGGPVE
jgi:ribonuclease Z